VRPAEAVLKSRQDLIRGIAVSKKENRVGSSGFGYLGKEVKETLNWLLNYKWPASCFVLFTLTVYMNSFVSVEKIPISLLSSNAILSAPIVISYFLFYLVLLALYICAPIATFFVSTGKVNGKDLFIAPDTNEEFKAARWKLMGWWASTQVIICLVLFLAAFVNEKYGRGN